MQNLEKLKDKRILVTGGAGFIGSEVVRQLCAIGAKVTVLDNFISGKKHYLDSRKVEIIEADVYDKEAVATAVKNQEIVFHLAALAFIPDTYIIPERFFQVNTMGTLNLLLGSIKSESVDKFIYISSSEVYGTAQYLPMDEKHPTLPHSTYAVSKLAAERATFTLHKENDFPVVIVRPFNSFGPFLTNPYIIPEIITQLLAGPSLSLGNIESSRDLTYVKDTANGIILAACVDEAIGETINIGSGKDVKIKDLTHIIANLMMPNNSISIEIDESKFRPLDVERLVCDNSKAQNLLDWRPTTSFEDGLIETISWVKRNKVEFARPY